MEIREVKKEEMKDAVHLVSKVFMEYEAKDYGKEGTETFFCYSCKQ